MFEFREFLHQNPSEDNVAFVFPSDEEMEVTPEMLAAISIVELDSGGLHEETFDFFQRFLQELYDGHIGRYMHYAPTRGVFTYYNDPRIANFRRSLNSPGALVFTKEKIRNKLIFSP